MSREIFIAGPPVEGELFFDREEVINDIVNATGNNFAIIGVRRIGKTSLIRKLAGEFKKKGNISVILSIPDIRPLNEINFLKAYTLAVISAYTRHTGEKLYYKKIKMFLDGKWDGITSFLEGIRVGYKDIIKVWFEYSQNKQDLDALLENVIQYPNNFAKTLSKNKEHETRFIIMLDEFQKIKNLGDEFLWSLREQMQKTKRVNYIISGSAVGMMNNFTGNEGSPFYGLFLIKNLKGLDKNGAISLLKRLEQFNITIPEDVIEDTIHKTSCYPLYIQSFALSAYLYAKSKGKRKIRHDDLKNIWKKTYGLIFLHFHDLISRISDKSFTILRTMAVNDLHSPAEIARSIDDKLTAMGTYLPRLINEGYIVRESMGVYNISDPIFKDWLKTNYGEYP